MAKPGNNKRNRKRADGSFCDTKEQKIMDHGVWLKQVLGETLELVMTETDPQRLRRTLNSASWKLKKAVMADAIQQGDLRRLDAIASYILGLTEVKKAEQVHNVNVSQNVQVLLAEITDVPFHVLEERAKQLRELKRVGAGPNRRGDEASESREILVVEDGAVQG